jgi:hypothetical protein
MAKEIVPDEAGNIPKGAEKAYIEQLFRETDKAKDGSLETAVNASEKRNDARDEARDKLREETTKRVTAAGDADMKSAEFENRQAALKSMGKAYTRRSKK